MPKDINLPYNEHDHKHFQNPEQEEVQEHSEEENEKEESPYEEPKRTYRCKICFENPCRCMERTVIL